MSFRHFTLANVAVIALLFAGCQPDKTPTDVPEAEDGAMQETLVVSGVNSASDPLAAFADSLRKMDNDNEVLVAVKAEGAPFFSPDLAGDDVIAFAASPDDEVRTSPGFAPASTANVDAVAGLLSSFDVEPYFRGRSLSVLAVRIPDGIVGEVLGALLAHPNVDYVQANQRRRVEFDAGPVGSNPVDSKHDFHDVQGAWDYTRGSSGVAVGILDSGYSHDGTDWHEDGQYDSSNNWGILKRGFVDDYGSCSQSQGDCEKRDDDDNAHGTQMTGLVGQNDNSIQYVGVAPQTTSYSMKVAQNCNITGCDEDEYTLEDDDMAAAVDYGISENMEVLSMSFSCGVISGIGGCGSSTKNALYDAYNSHDILLFSSAGNDSDNCDDEPQSFAVVIGVGGLNSDGSNAYCDQHQEVSALSGGQTTIGSCSGSGFCTPNGSGTTGGTSASTAIAAGIGALVRSYHTGWSNQRVRDRLLETAVGSHDKLQAEYAITGGPLTVDIGGPSTVKANVSCTWTAEHSGGTAPYSYQWYRDGQPVGTNKNYSASTGSSDFALSVDVTDSFDFTSGDDLTVTISVSGDDCSEF